MARKPRIALGSALALALLLVLAYNRNALADLGKTGFDEVQFSGGLVLGKESATKFTGTLLLRDAEISTLGTSVFDETALAQWMGTDTQGLVLEVEVEAGLLSGPATLSADLRRSEQAADLGHGAGFVLAKWFAPRQRVALATFSEGQIEGRATVWHPVGSGLSLEKMVQANFQDNKLHGQVLRFYESGEVLSEMHFEQGVPFGIQRERYRTGEVAREHEITKGGDSVKLYYRNGQLRGHQVGVGGQLVSESRWYPDGSQQSVASFEQGTKMSEKRWYSSGAIALEGTTLDPVVHEPNGTIREYHASGALRSERIYVAGVSDGPFKVFYDNDKPWEEGRYASGQLDGAHKKWWKNGEKALESSWKEGRKNGPWRRWYASGKPWEEAEYRAGKRVGPYRKWWKNGKLAHDSQYNEGGQLDGAYKTFYDNGQPRVETSYTAGVLDGDFKNWLRDGAVYEMATYQAGAKLTSNRVE